MNFVVFVFAFLIFNIVVISHEFGHYFTAKIFGVKVEEFALGMGPKFFSKRGKSTFFSMRCLPIGGFCHLESEDSNLNNETSFFSKSIWEKTIILIAGGVMNLILGFVFAIILSYSRGVPTTTVSNFYNTSISPESGLKIGDEILSINNKKTFIGRDILFFLHISADESFTVNVMREDRMLILKDVKFPRSQLANGRFCSDIDFRVVPAEKSLYNMINYSILDVYSTTRITMYTIFELIRGRLGIKDMAGPIGIATQINDITVNGLKYGVVSAILDVLAFMTMFSVSIGIFNLLPFPALDGGRIIFLIIEKIRGKRFKEGVEVTFHMLGFCLLIAFMIIVSYNDIARIFGNFTKK
ncbi:MAG: site-2 protease family protein [Candidatus Improbicoccus devescovinae]|nr:MAG: site-2 protease family protein [Candidatus Improbicoccus devescovinae]